MVACLAHIQDSCRFESGLRHSGGIMPFVVTNGGSHSCYHPAEQEARKLGTNVWYEGVRGMAVKVWPLEALSGDNQPGSGEGRSEGPGDPDSAAYL